MLQTTAANSIQPNKNSTRPSKNRTIQYFVIAHHKVRCYAVDSGSNQSLVPLYPKLLKQIKSPKDAADKNYRVVFETDGQRVTQFRAGKLPEVEFVEGCS